MKAGGNILWIAASKPCGHSLFPNRLRQNPQGLLARFGKASQCIRHDQSVKLPAMPDGQCDGYESPQAVAQDVGLLG